MTMRVKFEKKTIEMVVEAQQWRPVIRLSRDWLLWYAKVTLSCLSSVAVGCLMVEAFRKICKKTTEKEWTLMKLVFVIPLMIYLILNYASKHQLCDLVVADAFSFGVVLGILYKLNFSTPSGPATVKLIVHQVDGRSESVWLDSTKSTIGEARTKLATVLNISPATRICLESGKGSLLEDADAALIPYLPECVHRGFFGFTTVQCHYFVREDGTSSSSPDPRRRGSGDRSFMSLMGISNKIMFGQNLTLMAKVYSKKTDSRDVRALTISPIEKFAAAAPRSEKGGQSRLLSWHSVKEGDVEVFSDVDGPPTEDAGDLSASGKSAQSSPAPEDISRPRNSSMVSQVAGKLLSRNLDSSLPIRNGDIVVVESGGKFMAVAKGWWISWGSATPRRSGAFKIEILERGEGLEQQFEKGLKRLNNTMMMTSKHMSPTTVDPKGKSSPIDSDAILKSGDNFRLRNMKFPDYELGVTSDNIKGDYCYLGLRKVDAVDGVDKGGEEWCMPVRFSVKAGVLKM